MPTLQPNFMWFNSTLRTTEPAQDQSCHVHMRHDQSDRGQDVIAYNAAERVSAHN